MDRSSGPKSIFPKGPNFTLDDFSNKDFIVRDFVDSLAESAMPSGRRSGPSQSTTFDPKPLIRSFENALSQLAVLGDELQEKESELLSQVRRAEIQHDQTLDTLGRKLDETMESFEALDISLNPNSTNGNDANGKPDTGGNIAVQIGEKLDDLDKKRRRAQDTIFLISCWTELSETGLLSSLEDIRRQGGAENKVRCAVIARQLMRISQQLDPLAWATRNGNRASIASFATLTIRARNTREILEKFCETLEQDLLQQFNNSYRRQNFNDMMECAKVLYDFNGGASVIAVFVNQHQFFIDRDQLMSDEMAADGEMWEALADPDVEPPGIEPSLQSLIDEVKIVMQEESFIIKRAFPYYETVLIKFIQRVFQQSIQQRLEKVLDKAESVSTLAFLRSLHSSRSYIGSLVEDLKMHGLTEHPEPCSAQIAQALDQQLDELFVPFLVGSVYIEREKKSLEELYGSLLFKFSIFHSRRKKAPSSGFMASLAQQGNQMIQSAKDAYLERLESSELSATQKAMMLRVAGLSDKSDNKNEIEVADEDGILGVANAKRMLKWLAESVQRVLELGSQIDTPKDVNILLNLLLTHMGQVYIETALEAAHSQATILENTKIEPDMSYLPPIRPGVTISGLMERFISTVLIRLAESNTTVRKSMEAQKKMAIDTIEKKTNAVIKISIDVVVNWVIKSLGTQKKQDFRPKDGELESLQTATCLHICQFLARASQLASQAIDGHNAEKFFSELGLVLHSHLFDHFKRFQVNATGGLMVTQDIAKYVATLRAWPLAKDVETAIEMLTEIGSLFIVGPEALREKVRTLAPGSSSVRGKLSKADFKAFVEKRDDSGSVGIRGILSGL
ncbi:exocyst complex component sec10 domain-containing protein [Trichoderma breve]|uniref:Exocyst complex component sec10 domain-containing protein n=1 Tax=Trichoderma breve TaxID=2034170 RepID=A0A9W9JQK6_9HYPO|nr:exocyst complex component sec10 domain-containing protein [Trichoderma breve]KAJ4864178.1 exocyst complex component sec10 domain-containing protein [Trichoderma breve]